MISTVFVFSSTYIEMVQVDLDKKVVLATVTVAVESGVIARGKVVDVEKATLVLVELRKKLVVADDHVCIVVPEDSVISKSIELPRLSSKEIDEAVRWEAEGFLPYPMAEAVLDWKMLFVNGVSHILIQAMPRDIVESYVGIFEKIDVELAAIETPALALVRLAESQPGVRILLHVASDESVMTLALDQEVLATSVVNRSEDYGLSVVKTVQHMMQYYKKFDVQWIQVGGMGVNSDFVEALKQLGIKVAGFSLPFTVKPDIANQYLIALSASLKALVPPSDPKTINLLPAKYVKAHLGSRQKKFWSKFLFANVCVFAVILVSLSGVYGWLITQEKSFLEQQNSTPPVQKQAIEQANQANSLSQLVLTVAQTDFFPLGVFDKVKGLNKDSVQVAMMSIDLVKKSGELSGVANDRVAMLAFKQSLEEMEEIGQVYLPISSFTAEKSIPFQLKFTLTDKILTKEVK